nr:aminopeptidase B [Saccharomyces cerevisiae, Peptide Partial, 7 aa] [Saccharomyces cerevisiae]
ITLTQHR